MLLDHSLSVSIDAILVNFYVPQLCSFAMHQRDKVITAKYMGPSIARYKIVHMIFSFSLDRALALSFLIRSFFPLSNLICIPKRTENRCQLDVEEKATPLTTSSLTRQIGDHPWSRFVAGTHKNTDRKLTLHPSQVKAPKWKPAAGSPHTLHIWFIWNE